MQNTFWFIASIFLCPQRCFCCQYGPESFLLQCYALMDFISLSHTQIVVVSSMGFTVVCRFYTVQCCYSRVNFLQNPHNRHSKAHPWGRAMECLWESTVKFIFCPSQCSGVWNLMTNLTSLQQRSAVLEKILLVLTISAFCESIFVHAVVNMQYIIFLYHYIIESLGHGDICMCCWTGL